MSDDDSLASGSDSEDLSTTGLIATRAKRATAGNLYATLRQNLDDEEIQKELLAEDEDDQGDFVGSDHADDDAMSSSDDDEDQGPPKEGEQDIAGEKELKRQERLEAKKKRKMNEAKMRLPAWQKKKMKRVKLADGTLGEEEEQPAKPKKKSERSDWLPTAADMPVRQSSRAAAVANREMVHGHLKDFNERSEKQKKVMAQHSERQKANQRAQLTQEERIAKTEKIEKETARQFGRWEREEAERQRLREEALAAKWKRGIDGPFIRYWSGSVLWEGDKIKDKRLHGSQKIEDLKQNMTTDDQPPGLEVKEGEDVVQGESTRAVPSTSTPQPAPLVPATPGFAGSRPLQVATPAFDGGQPLQSTDSAIQPPKVQQPAPQPEQVQESSWLDGIHAYASQAPESIPYTPSAPIINAPPASSATQIYHGWPSQSYNSQSGVPRPPQQELAPLTPPVPLIKEQAQRSLIMLEQFHSLEVPTTAPKRASSKSKQDSLLEPTPVATRLLPHSYPSFDSEATRYLTGKLKRAKALDNILPDAPVKPKCALTQWPAKYRDPKTGLAFADLLQYKMVQRLLAGGCQWSGMLGCWVGPAYGGMGRPAIGVPDGFGIPIPPQKGSVTADGTAADVTMEGGG